MRVSWFHVSMVLTGLWVLLFVYIATQIGSSTSSSPSSSSPMFTSTLPFISIRHTPSPTSTTSSTSSAPAPAATTKHHNLSPKALQNQLRAQDELKSAQHKLDIQEAEADVNDALLEDVRRPPARILRDWERTKRARVSNLEATHDRRTPAPPGDAGAGSQRRTCGLTHPLCTNDEELFVTYTQGGGFNNQRQSIERAFQIALMLNRTLIVRDIWVDAKHNPGSNSTLSAPQFQPFELFFDLREIRYGVPTITEAALVERDPQLFAKRASLRGIFKSDIHWIESVPCDLGATPVRSITGDDFLSAEQLFGIIENLGCHEARVLEIGLVGMNKFWRASARLRRQAAKFVRLAPSIQHHAKQIWLKLMKNQIDPETARPRETTPDSFVCIHYRQGDKPEQSPREYNYTAQLIVDILKGRKFILPGEPVYVATDLPPERFDLLAPFVTEFNARMLATSFAPLLEAWKAPTNDYIAAIEVELCASARLFFGSSSTMSASIVNMRHGITGITDWETDTRTNFRLNRLSNEWKARHVNK